MYAKYRLEATGLTPLMMHNGRLADPLYPVAIEMAKISAKRKKTTEDHKNIAHLEFLGGLYYDEVHGVHVPAEAIEKCLEKGGGLIKQGAAVTRGVVVQSAAPLVYDGPSDPEELFADTTFVDRRAVNINSRKIMRTRPIFREWSFTVDLAVDTSRIAEQHLRDVCDSAGRDIGLGEMRPRMGQFQATLAAL